MVVVEVCSSGTVVVGVSGGSSCGSWFGLGGVGVSGIVVVEVVEVELEVVVGPGSVLVVVVCSSGCVVDVVCVMVVVVLCSVVVVVVFVFPLSFPPVIFLPGVLNPLYLTVVVEAMVEDVIEEVVATMFPWVTPWLGGVSFRGGVGGSCDFFSLLDSLYCVSGLVVLCVARSMIVKSPICVNMIPRDMASISSISGMYLFLFSFILRCI